MRARSLKRLAPLLLAALAQSACTSAREQQLPGDYVDDAAITTTVIAMAHAMELNVVAEGVETEAQLRFLHDHGCDEIQGYWLSPPLEAQRCLAYLRNWSPTTASGRAQAAP